MQAMSNSELFRQSCELSSLKLYCYTVLSKHVSFSYFIICFSIKLMLYSTETASLYQMISFRLRLWVRLSAFVSGASLIKLAPQTTEQKQESQLQFNIHCSPPIPVGQLMNKQWILILYFVLKIYRALRETSIYNEK